MSDIQEIYQETISRLPSEERLRLASLILSDLAATQQMGEKLSITELIKSFPAGRGSKTSAEADEYLRRERDSWGH
jgi:hypothetical protein